MQRKSFTRSTIVRCTWIITRKMFDSWTLKCVFNKVHTRWSQVTEKFKNWIFFKHTRYHIIEPSFKKGAKKTFCHSISPIFEDAISSWNAAFFSLPIFPVNQNCNNFEILNHEYLLWNIWVIYCGHDNILVLIETFFRWKFFDGLTSFFSIGSKFRNLVFDRWNRFYMSRKKKGLTLTQKTLRC